MTNLSKDECNIKKVIFCSVFEIVIGILGVFSWIVLLYGGGIELTFQWVLPLVLSLCFIWFGVRRIKLYRKIRRSLCYTMQKTKK